MCLVFILLATHQYFGIQGEHGKLRTDEAVNSPQFYMIFMCLFMFIKAYVCCIWIHVAIIAIGLKYVKNDVLSTFGKEAIILMLF